MCLKLKSFIIIAMCLISVIMAGCGDKKESAAPAPSPAKQSQPVPEVKKVNGIVIPEGFKLEKSGPDYIVVRSAKENQMGGPSTMYSFDDTKFCVSVIKACHGPQSIVGGYDGELVTIYQDGRTLVATAIGNKELQRYYAPGGNLLLFKLAKDNFGWRGMNEAKKCSMCNKLHASDKHNKVFRYTSRDGVKAALKGWNS